jgi:ATP-dependent Lhr-like helicase
MSVIFHPLVQTWFESTFENASPPQQLGWPVIAAGQHTLILAPTGSGKTLAAFLWCIDELYRIGLDQNGKYPFGVHTLYISPLKALNNDIRRNLIQPLAGITATAKKRNMAAPELNVMVRTGDTPTHVRQSMVKNPPHILITTPESLYLLLTTEKGREMFHRVRYLIVDEIHAMCGNKRGVHLSLSLERLSSLCETKPVRIGLSATQRPLDRVAAYLGGCEYVAESDTFKDRDVKIIDCGQKKDFDIEVTAPVPDFQDLPESSVWPAVILKLYRLITEHRTTLIFVNMRAQSEKIARLLNDLHQKKSGNEQTQIVLPHHGSMSREKRYDIEERLKQGRIPAVIATASLELGIDIGSIDLVVQLETPRSISAALQRVGRSGHLLNHPSKGRMIPLYPGDLDDAAAITRSILDGNIEETVIPENCLDVLAQQIVAEVALKTWSRKELYRLFRQSFCYRSLTESAFNQVIEMLNGRYAETRLPALHQRVNWDQINDRLIARSGTRLTAVMNGGTIPDRGYYAVFLADSKTRIGEMEEEFVFESRVGDVFYLGNNEWRIDAIQQDRLIVTPFQSVKPRPPFWKGELPSRDIHTSMQVSSFREKISVLLDSKHSSELIQSEYHLDKDSTENLLKYLRRQKVLTGVIPTHKNIVAELFRDSAGEQNLIIHSIYGGRINAAWALAITAFFEHQLRCQVQYTHNDDGILFRILETVDDSQINDALRLDADEVEKLILNALPGAPVFSIQFRYNAARSLILQRSRPGRRIPLWLQRLRAADLLQAVKSYTDFPVLVETYRSCIEDIFDVPHLKEIIDQIHTGLIRTHIVKTPQPSPMASGLIFNFVTSEMYQLDHSRAPGEVAAFSSTLLAEILGSRTIPAIVEKSLIKKYEARWQFKAPEYRAKNEEDLYEIIEKLGPIADDSLTEKSRTNPQNWIENLKQDGRIFNMSGKWICAIEKDLFTPPLTDDKIEKRLRSIFKIRGPVTVEQILNVIPVKRQSLTTHLNSLLQKKEIVHGKLVADQDQLLWCDRDNFAVLYRAAVVKRRQKTATADRQSFFRFQLAWHACSTQSVTISDLIKQYQLYPLHSYFFERELLRSRPVAEDDQAIAKIEEMLSAGEVSLRAIPGNGVDKNRICFLLRGQGHLLVTEVTSDEIQPDIKVIFEFLKKNGASFLNDILEGSELSATEVYASLNTLVRSGLISCDNYQAFLSVLNLENNLPTDSRKKIRSDRSRSQIRHSIQERMQIASGRWFLTESFAVRGKLVSREEQALKQARLLLNRYGIVVKEWYRHEHGLLPWFEIFQALKQMEWRGEILRGYFIHGLSGVQFALPEAISVLEEDIRELKPVMLSTTDPALPLGGSVAWEIKSQEAKEIEIVRSPVNHLIFVDSTPVIYCENYVKRMIILDKFQDVDMELIIKEIKTWLQLPHLLRPRKKIEIELINSKPAIDHPYATEFLENGFEQDVKKLVLWPSAV